MISLSRNHVVKILRFLESEYPLEGAGLLYGRRACGVDEVIRPVVVRNGGAGEVHVTQKPDWFEIAPRMMLWIDTDARKDGLMLLGSFHSHPDHPAKPSPRDLERAWPNLNYLICSVRGEPPPGRTAAAEWTCWTLNDAGTAFDPVVVRIVPDLSGAAPDPALYRSRTRESLVLPPMVE
jgi:proteasome lid subunit RPN8/RPN11